MNCTPTEQDETQRDEACPYTNTVPILRYTHRFFTVLTQDLSDLIFTQEAARYAVDRLATVLDTGERTDLMTIVLGRVLQVVEANEKGEPVESEVEGIVQCIHPAFTSINDERVREAAVDILRYLPVRSVGEIQFVLHLAENARDVRVQRACAQALQLARPETPDAWTALT